MSKEISNGMEEKKKKVPVNKKSTATPNNDLYRNLLLGLLAITAGFFGGWFGGQQQTSQSTTTVQREIVEGESTPSLGLLSINALVASDKVLIPVQAEFYALEGLGLLIQTIQRVQAGLNPGLQLLGIVMTMVDSRNALSGQVIDEVKKHFGDYVFSTHIPRNVRLAESPSFGKTIFEHDKWSKGAKAYKKLVKEIMAR